MRRVMLALVGTAALLATLVFLLGDDEPGIAAGGKALAAFICALAIGVPALNYCCRRQWWEAWRFLVFGAVVGFLIALPLQGGRYQFVLIAALFVTLGVVIGGLFWLAAIWRNRDLTYPKMIRLPCGTIYPVVRNVLGRRS